jgi:predicted RNA-binding Zn ribbon-like protein
MKRMASRRRLAAAPSEDLDVKRCLSLVNTKSGRSTAQPTETLASYDALLAWARDEGVLPSGDGERMAARAKRKPPEAERVLREVRDLRELLHDTFTAMANERAPSAGTLDELSATLGAWYRFGRLVPGDGALQWVYAGQDDLERVLWEVARSASRLLTSSLIGRVRPCAATDCGWWFLDDTKNGSRRWCDMKTCGNREKLRRFRERRTP